MAFEVARVHGLIRSNIGDYGLPWGFSPGFADLQQLREYSHFPSELSYDGVGSGQWSGASGSPIETSACSTETESDEDDELLAGLAEQIAHSMLDDDEGAMFKNFSSKVNWSNNVRVPLEDQESQKVAVSPPSSWSAGSWVSASAHSSKSSSLVSSEVSSPPTTPLSVQNDAWDLLYAAAGEVVRQKMNERRAMSFHARLQQHQAQQAQHQAQQCAQAQWVHLQHQQHTPYTLHSEAPASGYVAARSSQRLYQGNPTAGGISSPSSPLSPRERYSSALPQLQQRNFGSRGRDDDHKEPANQNRSPKAGNPASGWARQPRPQATQLQQASRLGNKAANGRDHHRNGRTADPNPPHRHNVPAVNGGSGMRAVFLGGSGSGRESGGTGVFLPRTVGSGSDFKRKPACSTVLLPTRIVQVLNLNVEDMRSNPSSPCSPVHHNVHRSDFSSSNSPSQKFPYMVGAPALPSPKMCDEAESWAAPCRKLHHPSVLRQTTASELSLPTEWTY